MNPPATDARSGYFAQALVRNSLYVMVAYFGLVGTLLFFENFLVFRPTTVAQHWQPVPPGHEREMEDVDLTCADGTKIHAWWCPCPGSEQALLYFHGNAGNLSHRGASVLKLRDILKASVLIVDYPGYGKSEGSPTEQGCYQTADAAYAWLIDKQSIAPKNLLLYGGSLGGGVAVDLASRKEHRALILAKTFTSMPDVACDIYWWVLAPIRLLMSNRFNNIDKIGSCHRPVFIAHSSTDDLIPFRHSQRLFEAANEPKRFLTLPDGGHNEPLPREFFTSLDVFLRDHAVE